MYSCWASIHPSLSTVRSRSPFLTSCPGKPTSMETMKPPPALMLTSVRPAGSGSRRRGALMLRVRGRTLASPYVTPKACCRAGGMKICFISCIGSRPSAVLVSGLAGSAGTRSIPQIGHEPGLGERTEGCIGQVQTSVFDSCCFLGAVVGGAGSARIRSIPQIGHFPGWGERIEGCMGQVQTCSPFSAASSAWSWALRQPAGANMRSPAMPMATIRKDP